MDFFTKDDPNKTGSINMNPTLTPVQLKMPEQQFQSVGANIKDASSYKDPTASLAYKANELYKQNSPFLQSVRTKVNKGMEARGLFGSASGMGAAESAVINNAASLAAPDAAAEQQRINTNQVTDYTSALKTQGQEYGFNQARQQAGLTGALTEQGQGFQAQLSKMGFDQNQIQSMSTIFGNLVDSEVAAMGAIMRTPDNNWDQTKQNDFESVINDSKTWLASLFKIPLA